ncbi:MAG: DUF6249 domain-containing protein [Gemmatimonadota bacterium]|nr:DUF6249 domain-containing protein [Gemmatimonadota bacterium]
MAVLVPIIGTIAVFGVPGAIIIYIIYSRHQQRMELIRTGNISSLTKPDVQSPPHPGRQALLWGLVFVGLGLAGLITYVVAPPLPYDREVIFFPLAGIVMGGAMLLYYRLLAPLREKAARAYETQLAILEEKTRQEAAGNEASADALTEEAPVKEQAEAE